MLCTVHDGDSSNLIGTLHRGLPTPPGVYTIDFTTGVGWTTGIRFYGQNTEQFFKITELSLRLF